MRLSFIVSKPAPAAAPVVAAPTASQKTGDMLRSPEPSRPSPEPGPAAQTPAPAPATPSPAVPAPAPEQPAPAAEQPRERRSRAARGGMSLKSMMDEPQAETAAAPKEDVLPSDEQIKAKWPELAKLYGEKPRLASMLTTTTLDMTENDGFKTVTFRVVNDAQKEWVESKLLHELEGNFRKVVGSMKVYLRVDVAPDDSPQEKKIYMPSDQAAELMRQNEQVKNLVKDLELDIK